ncbi:MAG: type 4a pilus biogenesis protein PilO [Acidobacteriota bacterium]
MTRMPPLWRRQLPLLAAAVLFAGGNLVFFLTYRSGWQTRRETLEARRDDLRKSAQTQEVEAERLATQRSRLSNVSSAIEEFYGHKIGPERETLAGIVGEVHRVLKDVGVSAPQISYSTQPVPKLPLTQMKITFSAKCDYSRFKRLLRAFEGNRRWIAIRGISINRDAEQPGSVTVQMDLATYFAEPGGKPGDAAESLKPAAARRAG